MLQIFFCSVDCTRHDAQLPDPLEVRGNTEGQQFNTPQARARLRNHMKRRDNFSFRPVALDNSIGNGGNISCSRVTIPTVLIHGPVRASKYCS
jgi:hypothetical protein